MHNLTSTLLCLSLLVVLGSGCNKDTAGASSGNDSFLAPATAPDLPKREAVDERNFSREGMPEQKRVSDGSEDIVKLTPEDRAAAKRMGPGRLSAPPATSSNGETVTAGNTAFGNRAAKPASIPASGKENMPALDYDRTLFTMSKTACYGNCRQFSLELTNDRRLILDAKNNMDRKGLYTRMLSAREYRILQRALEASEPAELAALYPSDAKMIPADVQATVLRYADVYGEERKVEVYYDAPKQLAQLIADLESWVDKDGWIKMGE
ncbi:MAG: DUF6438 domain-containing protein [Lewinella sp.]|nr:DUF6438 domain-containing protein [Lewinella sp.]